MTAALVKLDVNFQFILLLVELQIDVVTALRADDVQRAVHKSNAGNHGSRRQRINTAMTVIHRHSDRVDPAISIGMFPQE